MDVLKSEASFTLQPLDYLDWWRLYFMKHEQLNTTWNLIFKFVIFKCKKEVAVRGHQCPSEIMCHQEAWAFATVNYQNFSGGQSPPVIGVVHQLAWKEGASKDTSGNLTVWKKLIIHCSQIVMRLTTDASRSTVTLWVRGGKRVNAPLPSQTRCS